MKPIETEEEYVNALKRAEELISVDPEDNTKDAEELDKLVEEINRYEDVVYPMG